jgi:subtilase family serine protease
MNRIATAILVSATVVIGGSSLAFSQQVKRSGSVYSVQVCPDPGRPGVARCYADVVTDSNGKPLTSDASPNLSPRGYQPADLRAAYNVTANGSSTIAIVDAFGYKNAESDLGVYRKQFGLPPCTSTTQCFVKYNQSGSSTGPYPKQDSNWAVETALDLAMASAMCPGCKIILVQANTDSNSDLAAAVAMAASIPGVHVISNSYGSNEISPGSDPSYQPYDGAASQGIAVTVSSGDSGYYGNGGPASFPASTSYVTAVGGTSLHRNTNGTWSETAWSGSGSGCSIYYYAGQMTTNNGRPWQPTPCGAYRAVADVSAVADPNTGVAVYAPIFGNFSTWVVVGGTSVGAPLIAGIYGVNGKPASVNGCGKFLSCQPYFYTSSLNDVKSGSDGSCSISSLCKATQGWDGPTGLGTPNGTSAF